MVKKIRSKWPKRNIIIRGYLSVFLSRVSLIYFSFKGDSVCICYSDSDSSSTFDRSTRLRSPLLYHCIVTPFVPRLKIDHDWFYYFLRSQSSLCAQIASEMICSSPSPSPFDPVFDECKILHSGMRKETNEKEESDRKEDVSGDIGGTADELVSKQKEKKKKLKPKEGDLEIDSLPLRPTLPPSEVLNKETDTLHSRQSSPPLLSSSLISPSEKRRKTKKLKRTSLQRPVADWKEEFVKVPSVHTGVEEDFSSDRKASPKNFERFSKVQSSSFDICSPLIRTQPARSLSSFLLWMEKRFPLHMSDFFTKIGVLSAMQRARRCVISAAVYHCGLSFPFLSFLKYCSKRDRKHRPLGVAGESVWIINLFCRKYSHLT